MYIYKKQFFSLALLACLPVHLEARKKQTIVPPEPVSIFQEMHEQMTSMNKLFAAMHEQMDKLHEEMRDSATKRSESVQVTLEEQEDGKALAVVLKNIVTTQVKAATDEEAKSVKIGTDAGQLTVATDNQYMPYLWVSFKQEQTKQPSDKQEQESSYAQYSSYQQTVKHPIILEKVAVHWDEKQKTVTVILPYAVAEKQKNVIEIPVKKVE